MAKKRETEAEKGGEERERNRVRVGGIETDGKWKNKQIISKDGGALGREMVKRSPKKT